MRTAQSRWVALVLSVALAGMLAAIPSVSSAYPNCGYSTVARDYLASLKHAPIQEAPETGELEFAPPAIHLEATGDRLVVGSDWVGFSLTNGAPGSRKLDLIVESELVKVSARGKALSSLQTKRRSVGTIRSDAAKNFLHKISAIPAYYRVDIRFFRKGSDRALGEYSFYTRVMKPRVDVRVRIETPTASPGEMAKATLLNLGTISLVTPSYDYGFGVETFTGSEWILVPDNPRRLIPKRKGPWALAPGAESRGCLRYLVPSDQAPGLFRFVTYGGRAEPDIGMLAAEFQVVSDP